MVSGSWGAPFDTLDRRGSEKFPKMEKRKVENHILECYPTYYFVSRSGDKRIFGVDSRMSYISVSDEATKLGAFDYMLKPLDIPDMPR